MSVFAKHFTLPNIYVYISTLDLIVFFKHQQLVAVEPDYCAQWPSAQQCKPAVADSTPVGALPFRHAARALPPPVQPAASFRQDAAGFGRPGKAVQALVPLCADASVPLTLCVFLHATSGICHSDVCRDCT